MVREEFCPNIFKLMESGTWFAAHQSVFPSVTRAASASIATGCLPKQHGLHGNTMALPLEGGTRIHDVGLPEFPDRMRRTTGCTLHMPTLAQNLAGLGGSVVMSNVSPGGAYFQDPDGYGFVYHRAGSYGPGLEPVSPQDSFLVSHDKAGDRDMTKRFCGQVLRDKDSGFGVLWLTEPDLTGHHAALGSPEHLAAIASADGCVAEVIRTVDELRRAGREILCLVGSDHGQETVRRVINLDEEMVKAGFKQSPDSNDVLIAPQGTAALFYLREDSPKKRDAISVYLAGQGWAGEVLTGPALARAGLPTDFGLCLALSMAKSHEANQFGVPGLSDYAAVRGKTVTPGTGQHGGVGAYERTPFLVACGPGFRKGHSENRATGLIDIAPSILEFMGLDWSGMAGGPLQNEEAFAGRAAAGLA